MIVDSYSEMLFCGHFVEFIQVTAVFFSIIMINITDYVFVRERSVQCFMSMFNVLPYGELFDDFY